MKKNKMAKFFLIIILFSLCPIIQIQASPKYAYVTENTIPFTKNPNIESPTQNDFIAPSTLHYLDFGDVVTLTDQSVKSTVSSCKSNFYQVVYEYAKNGKTYTGYICGDYLKFEVDVSKYAEEFTKAGFPETYFEKLTLLKDAHPNWIFTAYQTNLDWNEVVKNESVVGISYIQVTDLDNGAKYISLDEGSYDPIRKSYIVREGSNWYAANAQTVAYYIDPRNFLTEREIFMFENLGYNENYQTLEAVQNVLKNTDLYPYANIYVEAATYNGNSINPVHLAASSKQEVVIEDGKLSGSANGTGKINDISYYNVYNLGAFSSCSNPVACAIEFAAGTGYDRPWTTLELSIKGGATYIANAYINKKQNTLYFKKWNVTSNVYGNYSNQYMTNIQAAVSEGRSTYDGYSKIDGLVDSAIEFVIPVYQNMPTTPTVLPTVVDTNTKEELDKQANEKQNSTITNIVQNAGYAYHDGYISGVKVGTSAQAVISKFKTTNPNTSIKITTIADNKTTEIHDGTVLKTGDILTITTEKETLSLRIIIFGDVNGDGMVTAVDYVQVKNCIMSSMNLTGSYKISADVDQDGKISAVDYVNIKNYIMKGNSIIQ